LRLGEYDFNGEEDCSPNSTLRCPGRPRDYVPAELVLHSGFNEQDRTEFRNDIALIRLQTRVELSGTHMDTQSELSGTHTAIKTRLELSGTPMDIQTEWSSQVHRHRDLSGDLRYTYGHRGYPMGTGALSPVVKRSGREDDHSLPSSAKVKMSGATPPLPHSSSRCGF
jgi:hypothetical protein